MILLGTARPFVEAVAAMASGDDIIAPRTKASGHPTAGMNAWATQATAQVVKMTHPVASNVMGLLARLKSGHDVFHAAAYRTGGRKIRNTTSGSSDTCGKPGMSPIPMPLSTRRIG